MAGLVPVSCKRFQVFAFEECVRLLVQGRDDRSVAHYTMTDMSRFIEVTE